jgi:hypothetical protein
MIFYIASDDNVNGFFFNFMFSFMMGKLKRPM